MTGVDYDKCLWGSAGHVLDNLSKRTQRTSVVSASPTQQCKCAHLDGTDSHRHLLIPALVKSGDLASLNLDILGFCGLWRSPRASSLLIHLGLLHGQPIFPIALSSKTTQCHTSLPSQTILSCVLQIPNLRVNKHSCAPRFSRKLFPVFSYLKYSCPLKGTAFLSRISDFFTPYDSHMIHFPLLQHSLEDKTKMVRIVS